MLYYIKKIFPHLQGTKRIYNNASYSGNIDVLKILPKKFIHIKKDIKEILKSAINGNKEESLLYIKNHFVKHTLKNIDGLFEYFCYSDDFKLLYILKKEFPELKCSLHTYDLAILFKKYDLIKIIDELYPELRAQYIIAHPEYI